MKKTSFVILLPFLFFSCAGAPAADAAAPVTGPGGYIRSMDVFIVYDTGSWPPTDAYRSWVDNNDIPREVIVRTPTAFTNRNGRVMLELDASLSGFRVTGKRKVSSNPDIEGITCEYSAAARFPAAKSRIVTFPASKLLSASGKVTSQAGEYGLLKAVESSGVASGWAWVRNVACDNGVFSVEVMM